jgi:plastocyanin
MKLMSVIMLVMLAAVVVFFSGIASARTEEVMIKDQQFVPHDVEVLKGDMVTWYNMDTVDHTVKFADSESRVLKPGDKYSKMFDKCGTYDYSCGIHPKMTGKVVAIQQISV